MVVALTPRLSPAKRIASAVAERSLTDFGPADVLIAAGSQPERAEDNSVWCVGSPPVCGAPRLSGIWNPTKSHPETCGPRYHAFGALVYSPARNQVRLFCDRLALMPLYVARQPGLVVIGDSLAEVISLLNEPLTTNDVAWAEWLTFGYFLGPQTPFEEVVRICPGETWTIELPGLVASVERFNPLPTQQNETIDRQEALMQFTELFQRAVERIANANDNLLVPLGGGWDSRLIAGALRKAGIPFETATTSRDSGNDLEKACTAKVATHLGVPNSFYELPPDYYLTELGRYTQATEYGSVQHVWQQSFIQRWPSQTPALVLDGYAGGLLLRGLHQPRPPTTSEPGGDPYDHYRLKPGLEDLLVTAAKSLVEALARKALQTELGPEPTPLDHLRFVLHNRLRRETALGPLRILSQKSTVAFPFLDGEVLDFAWQLPDRLRFDPGFYPDLLDHMVAGLGQIPSTSNPAHGAPAKPVPIHKHAPEVIAWLRRALERHPEELGQVLNPEKMSWIFARIFRNPARCVPLEFDRLELAAHFAQWLQAHAAKLRPVRSLHRGFAGAMTSAESASSQSAAAPQVFLPSDITAEIRRWRAFPAAQQAEKPRLPLLLTMDVEAFAPGDIYAAHTSEGDPFERLVLGRFPEQESILEKLYTGSGLAPWTLFVEMSALWRFGEQRLVELASLLKGSSHEVGLHLHPFSLSKDFFDARGLEWDSYQTGEGFGRILKEVAAEFTRVWGFAPRSYRSGRFDVYEGHFQALAGCGLRVDSSLYQNSPHNHSSTGHDIGNRIELTPEGILEIPVTSYLHRRGAKAELYPASLDLDFTPLPVAFELFARAQTQNLPAVVLLAHSWSFAESYRPKGIGKVVHFAPSRNAEEKLKWITEFCADSKWMRFGTCGSLSEERAIGNRADAPFDGLIEINGDPGRSATALANGLVTERHPWQAVHSSLTINQPAPATLRASWQKFETGDAFYLELFGGNFLEPPAANLKDLALLGQATEVLVTFRHQADAPMDIVLFLMQYAGNRRVRNESRIARATDEPRFETFAFTREPEAATFKIAIKLLPKETGPGWVQLDGLRLQRQS